MDLQMTKDQTYKTCLGEHLLHKKQPYANLSAMTFPPRSGYFGARGYTAVCNKAGPCEVMSSSIRHLHRQMQL